MYTTFWNRWAYRRADKIGEYYDTRDELIGAFDDMLANRPAPAAADVDLAAVEAAAPNFDPMQFLAAARECYYQMAEAWEHQDAHMADGLCGPDLMEALRQRIAFDRTRDRRHLLPGVEIHEALITSASVGDGAATIVVRLDIIGREYFADADGNIVKGDDKYRHWEEDWTFRRDLSVDPTGEDRSHALTPHDRGGWDFAHWGWDAISIAQFGGADLS